MRLIDADKLESGEVIIPTENGGYEYVEVFYKDDVDNAPSVDAVEVVRCKDCKYHRRVDWGMGDCEYPNGFKWIAYDNDFCSRGERREDNEAG